MSATHFQRLQDDGSAHRSTVSADLSTFVPRLQRRLLDHLHRSVQRPRRRPAIMMMMISCSAASRRYRRDFCDRESLRITPQSAPRGVSPFFTANFFAAALPLITDVHESGVVLDHLCLILKFVAKFVVEILVECSAIFVLSKMQELNGRI